MKNFFSAGISAGLWGSGFYRIKKNHGDIVSVILFR